MEESAHLGEMLDKQVIQVPDVSPDIEYAMNQFFLSDFEDEEFLVPKTEKIRVEPLNALMSYGISLHKYKNQMVDRIEKFQNSKKAVQEDEKKFNLTMPIEPNIRALKNTSSLNFAPADLSDFAAGKEIEVPELSSNVVNQILRKSVATMFAHIGYENCEESALNVMTDVLGDFLRSICCKYNLAKEDREIRGYDGFPHTIERVLTEVGMDGVKGLNDYYQARVIKYLKVLQNRCEKLNEQYKNLLIPKPPSPITLIPKIEKEEIPEMENSEVHFPLIDVDVNLSILEPGYQLLNSLEAQSNLQSVPESVGEIPESSGTPLQITEDSISNLSPSFSKKTRFK